MKLEAIDPLNLGNICVATVCKVSSVSLRGLLCLLGIMQLLLSSFQINKTR